MTKKLKSILFSLCGAFAFLFAGFFISGCDVDYSKISLVSSVSSVELEVGETAEIVFTVKNYKKGFSNRIQVNPRSDGTQAVFEAPNSSIRYLSKTKVSVTIKALAGGNGQLQVKTLEGEKECIVDVSVVQYSSSMSARDRLLYVSNDSDFVPSDDMVEFDKHTTETKLSYYYFTSRFAFDERTFKIQTIDEANGKLIGTDSSGLEIETNIVRFDSVSLDKIGQNNELSLSLNGQDAYKFDSLPSKFKVLSIYEYSVDNAKYEDVLYAFSDVYVLPSLNVQVSGGYLNENTNTVDFKPLDDERIVIVPNSPRNSDMRQYILKLEMISAVVDSEITFIKETSNNFVDVDLYDEYMEEQQEGDSVVHYWKISQNSQTQNSTELSFSVFYKLAADVFDESVNVSLDYQIDIEIAPTAITVNGTPEPEDFYLYNEYENDRFGWQEVFVDVISGFNSSPNYNGVYLTFDSSKLDVKYGNNDIVASGDSRLYTDLSKSFYVRGKGDLGGNDSISTALTIHLVSDILQGDDELSLDLNCIIIKGATAIQRSEGYTLSERAKFVFDVEEGTAVFNRQLYADQIFQDVTYRCQSVTSVATIEVDKDRPYIQSGGRFYLNLKITPITTGDAVYTIYLDNGTSTQINISVVKTLQPQTTRVFLLDSGNDAVRSYSYSRTEDSEFDNVLNLEILNNSTKDEITYGSTATLGFDANVRAGGIRFELSGSQFISVTLTGGNYRLTTLSNGNAVVKFTLRGDVVEDFATVERELEIYVNASSYSWVEEFYLQNGAQRAMENVVYYGNNTKLSDKTVVLNAVARNENSSNFNQYFFEDSFAEIFDYDASLGLIEGDDGYSYTLRGDEYYTVLQTEKFQQQFVYFYALRNDGKAIAGGVSTQISITKYWLSEGKTESLTKKIELVASNGLMFFAKNFSYEKKEDDVTVATYEVKFSNIYNVGYYGTFDVETLTYINAYDTSSISFVLEANVSQRGNTKRFNARITSQEYISVDNISLAANLTELDLSSKRLTHTFGVYIYPTNATNKKIITQFVPSTQYEHDTRLVDCEVVEGESGVYTVTVSAENFYKQYGDQIVNFTDELSGTLYIFPAEWGNSYTMLGGKGAIVIDIQYCNGSEKNPYVLETTDDVLEINSNEIMLRSHYKIGTIIDMSSAKNAAPIGILEDGDSLSLVGFSGSIIGTSSQAGFTNIAVSNNNFSRTIDGVTYAGLFAQIGTEEPDDFGQRAKIENVSFSGKIDIETENEAFVSLLTARNKGKLENVGVTLSESNIDANETLTFGAVAAENYGYILQDFTAYDGSVADGKYNGLSSKNLAYYNDELTVEVNNSDAFVGGIVGVSYGTVERKTSNVSTYKLYGYSAYASFAKINITGQASVSNEIQLGGAVGRVSNEKNSSKIFGNTAEIDNKVENLLVGGIVSTFNLSGDVQDAVGGIVGYATTNNTRAVSIVRNISRCFVRGLVNVGAVAGFDSYLENSYRVNFGTENRLEAVDSGNSVYEASMLIKSSRALVYNAGSANINPVEVFYSVGNALSGNRNYTTTGCAFTAISYVKRAKLEGVVSTVNPSTNDYYGDCIILKTDGTCNSYEFEKKDVALGYATSDFQMKSTSADGQELNVFMLFYFGVSGRLSGISENLVQDEIARLNYLTPNSQFYPFNLTSQDVSIFSASNELSVDVNGNITVKDVGFAYISLNSILNVKEKQMIYLYIVNYFDKDFDYSIFYTRPSLDGVNVENDSTVNIFGNSNTSLYLVPSYTLEKQYEQDGDGNQVVVSPLTADGDYFSITKGGILSYQNVSYKLANNTQLLADVVADSANKYSSVQTNKQTIIFFKSENADVYDGDYVGDYFTMKPVLRYSFKIGDKQYEFFYELSENISIDVEVRYNDSAEKITPKTSRIDVKTNEPFTDEIRVVSTNEDEVLFYEIFQVIDGGQELVQSRLPSSIGQYYIDSNADFDNWTSYINTITRGDLFALSFTKTGNVFNYSCKVNDTSKRFLDRANNNIYGEYKVFVYASELESGVSAMFRIFLSEAEIGYIDVLNYSDRNDLTASDEIVVPSQTGLLEIAIDPVEASFNTIEISNSSLNYQDGGAEASLLFVYERDTQDGVEFVSSQNFGTYENGKLTFTEQEMLSYFDTINESLNRQNGVTSKNNPNYQEYVQYKGKVYVSYYMPSLNVDDSQKVGFDVSVTYGKDNLRMDFPIRLITKLGSYAKLSFDNKQETDGAYYVARGLSYSLSMDSYGFSNDQISVSADSPWVTISGGNGRYTLQVTSENLNYTSDNGPGIKVNIKTYAEKVVDNVKIPYEDTLTVYIMEYVLNYTYVPGVNEDIVAGMENGTIYTAVGNPYQLEFSIRPFLEYDRTNSVVNEEVETFVSEMTKNIEWAVHYEGAKTALEVEKNIRTDYYSIHSYTVTPLRIYNPIANIYRFSASANYRINSGVYTYSAISTGANDMYTEFVFDVHEQSTQDSPIPVESYEDFIKMNDNEWYILLKDIELPSSEVAAEQGIEQFKPITANLAGFDGNGHKIYMSGTYDFADTSSIGVFQTVYDGMILQNVDICITGETVLKTNQATFNVGLLTASNEGVITNCEVSSANGASLSVVCSTVTSGAYVAGLVGSNVGHITNSRSKLNIRANVNVAGFAGQNSGIIASSYFKGASLTNQTNTTTEFTAGFVVSNSGRIYTSYVSGDPAEYYSSDEPTEDVYYKGTQDTIASSNNISGFVYSNSGSVEDCYSNIVLSQSGAFSAGFVFENTGNVKRSFSTSTLESNQTSNYGFVRTNVSGNGEGKIENCFYLSDASKNINVSIGTIVQNDNIDLKALTAEEFGNLDNFKEFVVEEGRNINSVWFITRNGSDLSNFNGSTFDLRRPELVAPNIEATSVRQLDRTESVADPETGMSSVRYVYEYVAGYPALGSVYNPILIADAQDMEEYITRENNNAGYNYCYYRIIDDIEYSEYLLNSKLYETKFMGYIEGNFMQINGLSLISSESLNYAGMFAEVGRTSLLSAVGTIMNLTVKPLSVSFANANVVGGIAGRLDGGTLVNVRVESSTEATVVSGNNIVGGVIGMAIGPYKMQNVYSQASAKARNLSADAENNFDEVAINFDKCSIAGSVVGVLSGTGKVYNTITDTSVSTLANKTGLVFGFIDRDARVEKVRLTVFSDMIVNAHTYGGLVVGESKGSLVDVQVVDNGQFYTNFKAVPYTPSAVGGVVGLLSGGTLSQVTTTQSIQTSTQSDTDGVPYVGGLVGIVSGVATVSNVKVTAGITGFSYSGGIAGAILADGAQVRFENIEYNGTLIVQGHSLEYVGAGGLVGRIGNVVSGDNSSFILTSSDGKVNRFNVTINSTVYTYGESVSINIGAIVGENLATGGNFVGNTNSKLDANIKAYEMSDILGSKTSVMTTVSRDVTADGTTKKESFVNITGTIEIASTDSSESKFFSKVTFESPDKDGKEMDISHTLTVTNVGVADVELETSI